MSDEAKPADGEEMSRAGLSDYGRGYEAGVAEYGDRQLRSQALSIASSRASGRESVLADARDYLKFLRGEES